MLNSQHKVWPILCVLLLLSLPLLSALRINGRWDLKKPGFNTDLLHYKQQLRNAVSDSDLVVAGNDHTPSVFLYYLHKKGWVFNEDQLKPHELKTMIANGARYLFTDSETIMNHKDLQVFFKPHPMQFNTIRVIELQLAKEE